MRSNIGLYDFFATPDDEKCLEKFYHYTRYSTITGSVLSIYEMVLLSKPTTLVATLGRFFHLSLPFVGAGAMYGATTCITAQLRGRDDFVNHVAGSFGALSVWVAKYNRMMFTFPCAVTLAVTMGYLKYMRQNNLEVMRMVPKEKWRYYPELDFTIKMYDDPGRPKDWQPCD